MATTTGGELAARALIETGAEYLFTLSGGHITPIYNHLEDGSVKMFDTRHEQAAVFMAEAWGRMTRKPGIAMVTAGPGFTNALTGVANARQANSPLLLVSGCVGVSCAEKLDLQDMCQVPVIEPMVKKSFACHTPSRIPEFVDMAYRAAASGRPGPVFLELPVDVLNAEAKEPEQKIRNTVVDSRPVDLAGARRVVEMLERAEQPMIIAGNGAWYADAGAELVAFAEKTGVPVFTAGMSRGLIPDTHPQCFEASIGIRPGATMHAQGNADLILLLGARISLFYMFGNLFSPTAKIVQVDIQPEEIGRNRPIDVPIFSDIQGLLAECNRLLDERGGGDAGRLAGWTAELREEAEASQQQAAEAWEGDGPPIPPKRLARVIDELMDREDDIIVADGGDTQVWMGMTRTARAPGRYFDSGLYGCLGVGLPYALAAKLRHRDSRVCLITGDGSIGFNFMEFETAIRHELPVVVVISNDLGWGMIRHSQELKLGHSIETGSYIGEVPYHKMVEALGGLGLRVDRTADIEPALQEAFASGKTACINVMTDPTAVSPGSIALAGVGAYG